MGNRKSSLKPGSKQATSSPVQQPVGDSSRVSVNTAATANTPGHRKTSSNTIDQVPSHHRKTSSNVTQQTLGPQGTPLQQPGVIHEERERELFMEELSEYYLFYDAEKLMDGEIDLEGIADWVLTKGGSRQLLNEKLQGIFGESLDEFLSSDTKGSSAAATTVPPLPTFATSNSDAMADRRGSNLDNGVLARPKINASRRRPTQQKWEIPMEPPADYTEEARPDDLPQQLRRFLEEQNEEELDVAVEELLSLEKKRGMFTLNSYLLMKYRKDLKGNVYEDSGQQRDPTRFGVGGDKQLLEEMKGKELRRDPNDSDILINSDGICSKFRLDTESPTFGVCKCGHSREAHHNRRTSNMSDSLERKLEARKKSSFIVDEQGNRTIAQEVTKPPPPPPKRTSKRQKPTQDKAHKFILDMNATTFGVCECGLARVDPIHVTAAAFESTSGEAAKPPPPPRPLSAKAEETPSGPCNNYVLDMNAASFGACANCGYSRMHHGGQMKPAVATTLERRWKRKSKNLAATSNQ